MFCQNCGKEISNNAKFCQGCGKPVEDAKKEQYIYIKKPELEKMAQGMINNPLDGKMVYFILSVLVTVFVGVGGLLPMISLEVFGYSRAFNIPQMITSLNKLEEITGVAIEGFPALLLVGATVSYIICVIYCVKFFLHLLAGERGSALVEIGTTGMWWGVAYIVLLLLLVWITNASSEEYLYGMQLFAVEYNTWLLLIAPLLNLYVLFKGYRGETIFGIPSNEHQRENERIIQDKRCAVCGTTYRLGSKCPKCGAMMTDE